MFGANGSSGDENMSDDTIDYGNLMHRAMRGLIQEVLSDVAANGLPGQHHFFITFDTGHPGVALAEWLRERYPEEMTIVIQHWYENLVVDDDGFAITLNFGNNPEPLYIPYDAIRTFVDPSVEFGLRFENHESGEEEGAGKPPGGEDAHESAPEKPRGSAEEAAEKAAEGKEGAAEVVSLDSFRK